MKSKIETSENENTISAKAVVIGCSHNNGLCDHKIHPGRKDFFTIDILPSIKPDLCMDITIQEIPEYLKNKFQLTILEYLPYGVYNFSKEAKQYFNTDGAIGLNNALDMTGDGGFVMVVGNSRAFHFRNSVSRFKYLEIAHSPDFDSFVLLIPKNQNSSALEAMEQVKNLPQELQNSIHTATTQGYIPSKSIGFCELNYSTTEKNVALIDHLNLYRMTRQFESEYKEHYKIFGFEFKFGSSRNEKLKAVDALIAVLLGNAPESSLEAHKESLTNGRLERIINYHLKDRDICTLTCKKKQFSELKERLTNLKHDQSIETQNSQEKKINLLMAPSNDSIFTKN